MPRLAEETEQKEQKEEEEEKEESKRLKAVEKTFRSAVQSNQRRLKSRHAILEFCTTYICEQLELQSFVPQVLGALLLENEAALICHMRERPIPRTQAELAGADRGLARGTDNTFWRNIRRRQLGVDAATRFRMFSKQFSLFTDHVVSHDGIRDKVLGYATGNYATECVRRVEMSVQLSRSENWLEFCRGVGAHRPDVDVRFLLQLNRHQRLFARVTADEQVRWEQCFARQSSTLALLQQMPLSSSTEQYLRDGIALAESDGHVVGFDLAGNETEHFGIPFVAPWIVEELKRLTLGVRIHLCEIIPADAADAASIRSVKAGIAAILSLMDQGVPVAVGHGLHLLAWISRLQDEGWFDNGGADLKDPLEQLRRLRRIEVCPFSNWYLVTEAPLIFRCVQEMVAADLPIVIASDDPVFFTRPDDACSFFMFTPAMGNPRIFYGNLLEDGSVLTLQYLFLARCLSTKHLCAIAARSLKAVFPRSQTDQPRRSSFSFTPPKDMMQEQFGIWA